MGAIRHLKPIMNFIDVNRGSGSTKAIPDGDHYVVVATSDDKTEVSNAKPSCEVVTLNELSNLHTLITRGVKPLKPVFFDTSAIRYLLLKISESFGD